MGLIKVPARGWNEDRIEDMALRQTISFVAAALSRLFVVCECLHFLVAGLDVDSLQAKIS